MSGLVKVSFLLFFGLVLAVGYNTWPVAGHVLMTTSGDGPAIDVMSYAAGLLAGMLLWQIGSVPWVELPGRIQRYLVAQMHFYQFVVMGGACLLVLIYF